MNRVILDYLYGVFPCEEPTVAEGVVEEMIAEVDEAGIDRAAVEEKAEEVSRTVS